MPIKKEHITKMIEMLSRNSTRRQFYISVHFAGSGYVVSYYGSNTKPGVDFTKVTVADCICARISQREFLRQKITDMSLVELVDTLKAAITESKAKGYNIELVLETNLRTSYEIQKEFGI